MAHLELINYFKGKKVLVTGHTGFKGSWLSLWLLEMGAQPFGYALAPPTVRESLFQLTHLADRMPSQFGDIRDRKEFVEYVNSHDFDLVFHLAAQPLVRESYADPIATYETNVMGTIHLLDALRSHPTIKSAVIVTTDKCYENKEWVWPYKETDPLGGHDPYSSSKAMAELATHSYRQSFFRRNGPHIVTARGGNVVGGGDFSKDRLIPDIVASIKKNLPVSLRNPHSVRPWQHVLDALYGYLVLAYHIGVNIADWSPSYNFAPSDNTNDFTVLKITKELIQALNQGAYDIDENSNNPHEATMLRLDSSLANSQLGWTSMYSTKQTIHLTAKWYEAHLSKTKNSADLTLSQIRSYMEALS